MLILGVDPGKTTGLAIYDTLLCEAVYLEMGQWDEYGLVTKVNDLYVTDRVHLIVCEKFVLRSNQAVDITPAFLIGALKGANFTIHEVMPSTHKGLVKDFQLAPLFKQAGEKIGAGHSRDALRLCLYWSGFQLKDRKTLEYLTSHRKNPRSEGGLD